jgi:hypothetical protein
MLSQEHPVAIKDGALMGDQLIRAAAKLRTKAFQFWAEGAF